MTFLVLPQMRRNRDMSWFCALATLVLLLLAAFEVELFVVSKSAEPREEAGGVRGLENHSSKENVDAIKLYVIAKDKLLETIKISSSNTSRANTRIADSFDWTPIPGMLIGPVILVIVCCIPYCLKRRKKQSVFGMITATTPFMENNLALSRFQSADLPPSYEEAVLNAQPP